MSSVVLTPMSVMVPRRSSRASLGLDGGHRGVAEDLLGGQAHAGGAPGQREHRDEDESTGHGLLRNAT